MELFGGSGVRGPELLSGDFFETFRGFGVLGSVVGRGDPSITIGNANLFIKCLFTSLLLLNPPSQNSKVMDFLLNFYYSPFRAPEQKDFPFFPCGATLSRTVPETQPLQVAFSLLERVDLRSQKERILGNQIAWGRVGWTGHKKAKRMRKKKVGLKGTQTELPGECLTPLVLTPLVAERAFLMSDYWGRTGVARCAEEMTGICRDFQ